MKQYRVRVGRNFKVFLPTFVIIIISIVVITVWSDSSIILVMPLLMITIPSIVIHLRYIIVDYNKVLSINGSGFYLQSGTNKPEKNKFTDIVKIVLVDGITKDRFILLPSSLYYNYSIHLKNGKNISFTCLLIDKKMLYLFKSEVEIKHKGIAWI